MPEIKAASAIRPSLGLGPVYPAVKYWDTTGPTAFGCSGRRGSVGLRVGQKSSRGGGGRLKAWSEGKLSLFLLPLKKGGRLS